MSNANGLLNNGGQFTEEVVATEKGANTMERFIKEDGVIVGITKEFRDELINKIIEVFDWCECYPECNYNSVGVIVDTWFDNKRYLLNQFAKSSFWNEEKLAIDFNKPIMRSFDKEGYVDFLNLMRSCASKKLTQLKLGNFTYAEILRYIDRLSCRISYLNDARDYGAIVEDHIRNAIEERRFFEDIKRNAEYNAKYYITNNMVYLKTEYDFNIKVRKCLRYLMDRTTQFLSEDTASYINEVFEKFGAKEGQKTSRVVNKLCKMIGLTDITKRDLENWGLEYYSNLDEYDKNAYNPKFAKFADCCNPFSVQKHILISLHPIDYLTMSWGTNWSSCHSTDKTNKHNWGGSSGASYSGCYSSGCESYMLDESSVIMYILSENAEEEAKEKDEPVPRKEMRQMFHIGEQKFIQARLYPYDQTDRNHYAEPEDYVQYREIMQSVLAEIWDVPNLWTNKRGSGVCSMEESSDGTHYRDYEHYSNVNVSYLKEYTGTDKIYIGHDPICPSCGETHSEEENSFCYNCKEDRKRVWCEYHEEYEYGDDEDFVEVNNYGTVCRDALSDDDNFHRCERCGDWFYDDGDGQIYSEHDDIWFCGERCAERDDYYYVEFVGDYIHINDFSYSEIDQEDLPTYDMDYYDLCYAIYDIETGGDTIAKQSSCIEIDGQWYAEDLCVETVDGDFELINDCIELDGAWYLKTLSIKDLDVDEAYEFYKKVKAYLLKTNNYSYEVLKQYLYDATLETVMNDVA